MKKVIVAISIVILLVSVIAVSINTEPEKYYIEVTPKVGQPELMPLSNMIFDHIEVTEWNYTSIPFDEPVNEFYPTTDGSNKNYNPQVIYYDNYHYDILQKGKETVLRIFVPAIYYENGQKINTDNIKMRVYYEPTFKTLYDPQWAPVDYLVITTETFWSTVNDNFKDWKKANDKKITEPIQIVNILEKNR